MNYELLIANILKKYSIDEGGMFRIAKLMDSYNDFKTVLYKCHKDYDYNKKFIQVLDYGFSMVLMNVALEYKLKSKNKSKKND